jgi:hypothetical protein
VITSRRTRWIGNAYCYLVEKPEAKRTLGRPRYKWEDNILINLKINRMG